MTKNNNIENIEKYKLDSKNLSYIFNSFATEIETSYKKNVKKNSNKNFAMANSAIGGPGDGGTEINPSHPARFSFHHY